MVKHIEVEDSLLRADELQRLFQISARQLERLFWDYVGLPPKWISRLFRLHQLGYFDQAYCLKVFKACSGK